MTTRQNFPFRKQSFLAAAAQAHSVSAARSHGLPPVSKKRSTPWSAQANAPESGDAATTFRVTHPFHPLFGQTLDLLAQGREWGEERVYYRDENGRMRFLPAKWTNLAAPDPFVLAAAGRAFFRVEDLIRIHDRLKECKG